MKYQSVYEDPTVIEAVEADKRHAAFRLIRADLWLRYAMWFLIGALAMGALSLAYADDYQCVLDAGCPAIMPGEGGPPPPNPRPGVKYTKVHIFKKGDIVSTASGWIVNPYDGWDDVDLIIEVGERAGVLAPPLDR